MALASPELNMTSTAASRDPLSSTDMQALLNEPAHPSWWRRPVVWSTLTLLLLGGGAYTYWQKSVQAMAAPAYVTAAVGKGNLTLSVAANGTLQPTRSVSIGSELSGTVRKVYVDVNDRVKKGQVLVELDTAKLSDQVARSRATLAAAKARVTQVDATLKEAQSNLARLEEVSRLSGGKVPSAAELDSGRATVARAVADQLVAQANVAEVTATTSTDATNLSKASIRSPIDGVVLTRTVDPGNAVAASLQAVTLFTVAEDLAELRLQVNVDEADVGAVKVGQQASFTVSAYPTRKYPATITRVAFGSTITENVVTYVTYLDVDNTDLSLRPGMTAAATITATERQDVLLVPSSALRFQPPSKASDAAEGGIVSSLLPKFPSGKKKATGSGTAKQVWVLENGVATAVSVTTGINDGRMTEVTGGDLREGMQVITDQRSNKKP
jgi:HlyD family secretion protein